MVLTYIFAGKILEIFNTTCMCRHTQRSCMITTFLCMHPLSMKIWKAKYHGKVKFPGSNTASNYQTYLSPLNPKAAPLSPKFYAVKPTDGILSISIILHIDKSKSYKTRAFSNQDNTITTQRKHHTESSIH